MGFPWVKKDMLVSQKRQVKYSVFFEQSLAEMIKPPLVIKRLSCADKQP